MVIYDCGGRNTREPGCSVKRVSFSEIEIGEEFIYFGNECIKTGEDNAERDGRKIFVHPAKTVTKIEDKNETHK